MSLNAVPEYWLNKWAQVINSRQVNYGLQGLVVEVVGPNLIFREHTGKLIEVPAMFCDLIDVTDFSQLKIPVYDPVNKPAHYAADRKYEPIDVIEDWFPASSGGSYHKGNALKYMSRAGRKIYPERTLQESEAIDLEKAVWYLQRRIQQIKIAIDSAKNVRTSSGLEPSTPPLQPNANSATG